MAKKFWWPKRLTDQMSVVRNFKASFPKVAPQLGFSAADVTYAIELCDSILASFAYVDELSSSAKAATTWRNTIFYGKQKGTEAASLTPVPAPPSVKYLEGSVDLLFALRDRIIASPTYTTDQGYELGLIGPEKMRMTAAETIPELKISVSSENILHIAGSMKGCDALRVEYAPEGGNFSTVAFLTRTPHGFQLKTQQPGVPEKGNIRAVFIKANEQFGSYSSNYPIGLW